jgi:hypothetical protein
MGKMDHEDTLRALVRRYHVTMETRHEMGAREKSVAPIGYSVELSAVVDHAPDEATIDCPECNDVERALGQLTAAVAPSEVVHIGHGTRQLGSAHAHQPEVPAVVTVLHRDGQGAQNPPDDDMRKRRDAILRRLHALGVQEGQWHEEPAPRSVHA